jgi:hypothetical protein
LTNRRDFCKLGAAKADLNLGGALSPRGSSSRPDPQVQKSNQAGKGRKNNECTESAQQGGHFNVVIGLSLSTATATTTNVIFSCEEDEGEYADTDLETYNAGNIYGTTVLGGDFGGVRPQEASSQPL